MKSQKGLRYFAVIFLLLLAVPTVWSDSSSSIRPLRDQLTVKHDLESTLEEIHNSYGFFNFPIFDEGTPRLLEACPNFKVMSFEDKKKFWRNFWFQLAIYESSGEMVKAKGIHGDLCGYLQLPCELFARKAKVRSEYKSQCTGDINSNNINAGVNNFRCGMAILQTQIDGANEIFPDKSKQFRVYWQPLRSPKQMYHKICNFQGCGNTFTVCQELVKKRENELK